MPKAKPDPARDISIAGEVERHVKGGLTISAACRVAADEFTGDGGKRLSTSHIEQIYRRNRPRTVS